MKTGKITFEIHYEQGVLPEVFPEDVAEDSTMEIHYNATSPRRKELSTAVGSFFDIAPVYQKAPTFAFAIGEYIIDRDGTLIGAENPALTEALAEQGFTVASSMFARSAGLSSGRQRRSTWYAGTVMYPSSGNEKSASRKKNGLR